MFEPTLDISAPTKHRFRQRLRLRRFLLASAFSALYLVVLAIFYTQGSIAGQTLLDACAIVAAKKTTNRGSGCVTMN